MKNTFLFVFGFIGSFVFLSCNPQSNSELKIRSETELKYDSVRAKKYGADAYGMKKYVIAFLKPGPNRELDSLEAMRLQEAHMNNINKMAEDGKLVLAGPFWGGSQYRGLYIFDVETIEEAESLTKTDPAVQAGSLEMELHKWYGSAALLGLNDVHKTLSKESIF
ncbi:MAG: YciI family protein [Bacteroidia bacterium]